MSFTKSPHVIASSDVMQTFCEARTCQNKMATIQSNNTKSDEMKIMFNCSAGVDGKDKRSKRRPVAVTNQIKMI